MPHIASLIGYKPSAALEAVNDGLFKVTHHPDYAHCRVTMHAFRDIEADPQSPLYGKFCGCAATWAVQHLLGRPFTKHEFISEGKVAEQGGMAPPIEGWDRKDTWEFMECIDFARKGTLHWLFKYCDKRQHLDLVPLEVWGVDDCMHGGLYDGWKTKLSKFQELIAHLKRLGI